MEILSIIMTICLLLCASIPTYALSTDDSQLSGYEISIIRLKSQIAQKSDYDIAKEILQKVGFDVKLLSSFPEDKVFDIANITKITKQTEYY